MWRLAQIFCCRSAHAPHVPGARATRRLPRDRVMAACAVADAPAAAGAAAPGGPVYAALRGECEPTTAHAEAVRILLQGATRADSAHWGDGTHLNSAGMKAAVLFVALVAKAAGVPLVVSDSTLCAVDGWTHDKQGDIAHAALPAGSTLELQPRWGAAFLGGGWDFAAVIWAAWRHNRCHAVQVFVAGNDLVAGTVAADLATEMRRVRALWLEWDVQILYIDVVPSSHHHH